MGIYLPTPNKSKVHFDGETDQVKSNTKSIYLCTAYDDF